MIPLYLEFQAFGPYPQKETIEFSRFANNKLFLIRGETGAGKTVILDAITYALYGRSSGAGRGDLVSMRCQYANEKDVTYTRFIFCANHREYRFERSLYRRKKRNGTIEYEPRQDVFMKNDAEEWIPVFTNPRKSDVDAEAVKVIGLQYDQFRQVVILPQGQFERLLVANSEDKEAIMSSLFGTSFWGAAAELLGEKAREKQRQAEQQGILCRSLLDSCGCADVEALHQLRENIASECKKNVLVIDTMQRSFELLQAELSAAVALEHDFIRLDHARETIQMLEAQQQEIDKKRELLRKREFNVLYRQWDEMNKEAIERRKALRSLSISIFEKEEEIKRRDKNIQYYDERIAVLEQEASHEAEYAEICSQYKLTEKKELEIIQTRGIIERLGQEADEVARAYTAAQTSYDKASKIHWKQVEATLASQLRPGKVCPVCGSKAHPALAKAVKGEAVSSAVLDELFHEADVLHRSMNEKYSEIQILRLGVEKQLRELQEERQGTDEDYRRALKKLESCRTAKSTLKSFLSKRSETTEYLTTLRSESDKMRTQKEQMLLITERCEENEKILRQKVLEMDPNAFMARERVSYLTAEEYAKIEEEIRAYDARLAETLALVQALQNELSDKKRPLVAELRVQHDATAAALKKMEQENALLERKSADLLQLQRRYDDAYHVFSELSQAAEKAVHFSRLLRGSKGVGLQRYVLGAMLTVVTEEANRLLRNVHGGRYQIFRTDSVQGLARKSGLELEVLDRWSGERRSVTSLSGGEKFLVALSLSIGLSGAVQARSAANKLGAIFIDEGFGTLDRDSMQDALHILSSIGAANGLVGIISHVQALQETIPSGIVVQKGARGSTLHTTYE